MMLVESGMIDAVLTAMRRFNNHRSVQRLGCTALWVVLVGPDTFSGNRRNFINAGGIDTIIGSIARDKCNDVVVQLQGFDIIWECSSIVGRLNFMVVVDLCNHSMGHFNRVQQIQCTGLRIIKQQCPKLAYMNAATVSTIVQNVCNAMVFFKESRIIQCHGCSILRQLSAFIVSNTVVFSQVTATLVMALSLQIGTQQEVCDALAAIICRVEIHVVRSNAEQLCCSITRELVKNQRISHTNVVCNEAMCRLLAIVADLHKEFQGLPIAEGTIDYILDFADSCFSSSHIIDLFCGALDGFFKAGCKVGAATVARTMDVLLKVVHDQSLTTISHSKAWSCINTIMLDMEHEYIIPVSKTILHVLEKEMVSNVLQPILHTAVTLCFIGDNNQTTIKHFVDSRIIEKVVSLIMPHLKPKLGMGLELSTATEACRFFCAIIQNQPAYIPQMENAGVCDMVVLLLDIASETQNHLLGRLTSTLARYLITTAQASILKKGLIRQASLMLGCPIHVINLSHCPDTCFKLILGGHDNH